MPPVLQLWQNKLLVIGGNLAIDPACCCGDFECIDKPFNGHVSENCITYNPQGPDFLADLLAYAALFEINYTVPDGMFGTLQACFNPDSNCDDELNNLPIIMSHAPDAANPLRWHYETGFRPECNAIYQMEFLYIINCVNTPLNCTERFIWTIINLALSTINFYEWTNTNLSQPLDLDVLDEDLLSSFISEGPGYHCPAVVTPANITSSLV